MIEYYSAYCERMNSGSDKVLSFIDNSSELYKQVEAITEGTDPHSISSLSFGDIVSEANSGGVELPASGHPDFVDNRMNPGTGAILVKYRFDNPDGTLVPGGLVTLRVRLLLGRLLLVPQEM